MVKYAQYRDNVGIVILNCKNEVFLGNRADKTQVWQMPQGGIKQGEFPLDAVLRELEEETGLKANNVKMINEYPIWLQYDFPENIRSVLWSGRYKGQRQKWFLFRLMSSEDSININTKHFEFRDWKWASTQEVLSVVVDFKKDMYIKVMGYFMSEINIGDI